jgi:hypothetical protein
MKRHCVVCGEEHHGFGSYCPQCWQEKWGWYLESRERFPMQIVDLTGDEDTTEVAPVDTANLEAMRRFDATNDHGRNE